MTVENENYVTAEIPGGSIAGWDYKPDWETEIVLTTEQLQSYMVVLRLYERGDEPNHVDDETRNNLRQWRKIQATHDRLPGIKGSMSEFAVYSYYADGRLLKSTHHNDDKWVVKKNSMWDPF